MRQYPIWHLRYRGAYDSLVDVLLDNRSLTREAISDAPEMLLDPLRMQDMDRAVGRILDARKKGERVVVFGDYDVDGVTSTALLMDFLDRVGIDAVALLPDRYRDGYGMKPQGVERALAAKADLILTSDNGISAFEAIAVARAAGVDVVVIDHHQPQDRLPDALAVVDPNRPDCGYAFKGLAAVGVAFKVVQAASTGLMRREERVPYLNSLLDLVALGTVADVAPMVSENRLLTRRGMRVMDKTTRPGLRALREAAGSADKPVNTTAIAYFLGPRINSAGRLGSAGLALDLLRSRDEEEARRLAEALNALNARRMDLQNAGIDEAREQVEKGGLVRDRMLVVHGEDWHLGVIGLIAGRLSEVYGRPSAVCTGVRKDGTFTGSARTSGGYNIVEAIFRCADLLSEFGGHAEAAGFTLPAKKLEAFRDRLIRDANQALTEEALVRRLEVDVELDASDISLESVSLIEVLEPFGPLNESPCFMVKDCSVRASNSVGGGKHLKMRLQIEKQVVEAIWWRQGALTGTLSPGKRVDVAFSLVKNIWNGHEKVELEVKDVRPAEA